MKTHIASLLLLVGTVLGGIAAANSAKASRVLALEADDYAGEFLAWDVTAEGAKRPGEAEAQGIPVIAGAGDELTGEVVTALRGGGIDSVEVKDPPIDHEILSLSDREAVEGRILATAIRLGEEETVLPEGRRVMGALLGRLSTAGMSRVQIEKRGDQMEIPTAATHVVDADITDEDREAAQEQVDEAAGSGAGDATPATVEDLAPDIAFDRIVAEAEDGARLIAELKIVEDIMVDTGAFLDAPTLDRIAEAGVTEVDARIVKRFRFGGWEQRYLYLAALVAMVAGVGLKRSVSVGDGDDGGATAGGLSAVQVKDRIAGLAEKLEALAKEVDSLDAAGIHAAVDPLIAEDVYSIVESRHAVSSKLGPRGFVTVFGPFASAERQLNRAWSAAVDGNAEEARDCVRRGAAGMADTARSFAD